MAPILGGQGTWGTHNEMDGVTVQHVIQTGNDSPPQIRAGRPPEFRVFRADFCCFFLDYSVTVVRQFSSATALLVFLRLAQRGVPGERQAAPSPRGPSPRDLSVSSPLLGTSRERKPT